MSPQITFKSNPSRPPAPGEALTDSAGKPVAPAPTLADVVVPEYRPSHGRAPDRLPVPPSGLVDLGPAAALRVIGPELAASSAVTLVTGPSRTADIEQNLIRGVHGPGDVHVVFVEP
jgi:hypothetical protein